MQVYSECVALLGDVVESRNTQRDQLHREVLEAIAVTNSRHPSLDPLRVTVGDEMQGIYATLGQAISALFTLRDELLGVAEVRAGLGGGQVQVIDAGRGIQDGSAWWNAREAIQHAKALADQPGHRSARTAVIDSRGSATPLADPTLRLVDAQLAGLSPAARRSWRHLRAGIDNAQAAALEHVTASANSQRVNSNALRPLLATTQALERLP